MDMYRQLATPTSLGNYGLNETMGKGTQKVLPLLLMFYQELIRLKLMMY